MLWARTALVKESPGVLVSAHPLLAAGAEVLGRVVEVPLVRTPPAAAHRARHLCWEMSAAHQWQELRPMLMSSCQLVIRSAVEHTSTALLKLGSLHSRTTSSAHGAALLLQLFTTRKVELTLALRRGRWRMLAASNSLVLKATHTLAWSARVEGTPMTTTSTRASAACMPSRVAIRPK